MAKNAFFQFFKVWNFHFLVSCETKGFLLGIFSIFQKSADVPSSLISFPMSMECCGRRFNIGASRKVLGVLCLLGVVFIWVVSGELIKVTARFSWWAFDDTAHILTPPQFIFTSQDFWAPFFLTYFNTALFTSYLLGFLFRPQWWGERGPPRWMCWMKLCQRKNINEADDDDDGDEEELDQDRYWECWYGWTELTCFSAQHHWFKVDRRWMEGVCRGKERKSRLTKVKMMNSLLMAAIQMM